MNVLKKHIALAGLGTALLAQAAAAPAHHSYTSFGPTIVTFTGTVKSYQYTSPHIWTQILVKDKQGETVEWGLESGSPASMRQAGFSATMLKPGDKITVRIHPKRSGVLEGSVVSMTLPTGRIIEVGDLVAPRPGGVPGAPRP